MKKDIPVEINRKPSTNDILANCEPIEIQFERLRRKVEDMKEKQDAVLSYLENIMGVELVRNVRNSRLRFADKDSLDA